MLLSSKYKSYLIFAIVFFASGLSLNLIAADSVNSRKMLGKPSPNFFLPDLNGQEVSLGKWQGKLVLINFWATWCLPCMKEIPVLNTFQKRYADDDFQVVGIAIDNIVAIKKFTQKIPIQYPTLIGDTQLVLKFGNRAGALPYSVIIDQQGKIVEIASGMLTETYLQRTIEKHL